MTLAAPAQTQVVWLDWDDYLAWLRGELAQARNAAGDLLDLGAPLEPGQHMPIIGPTGCAKTTHAVGFLGANRRYVLALDPKGEDETLAASGYIRVKSLPKTGWRGLADRALDRGDQRAWEQIYKRIDAGHDARVIVGGGSRTDEEDESLRVLMRDAITFCRHSEGWCLYVDEFELLSSQRMMRLGDMIERMLITARRDLTSVITSFQAPAWVSKHATRQASKAVAYPQSGSMIKSIADEMGWDWQELAAVLDQLPKFHTATIGRGRLSGPIVITKAPRLAAPKPPQTREQNYKSRRVSAG
jgi:hypothetical protein